MGISKHEDININGRKKKTKFSYHRFFGTPLEMKKYNNFYFESYQFDKKQKKLTLNYSLDGEIKFTEAFTFGVNLTKNIDQGVLNNACEALWIMAGISYYKTTLAKNICFRDQNINIKKLAFFQYWYRQGLGEFFFVNNIKPLQKIFIPVKNERDHLKRDLNKLDHHTREFDSQKNNPEQLVKNLQSKIKNKKSKILLPIGGGKDSLVSAHILTENNLQFSPFMVGSTQLQRDCCQDFEPIIEIKRTICPNLIKLNKEPATLNGHVPISLIWAFTSVITALLTGKKFVVLSNEASANTGNIEFHGQIINHQYSKSYECEVLFRNYVNRFITKDVEYFSLLRQLKEIEIAQIFAEKCWDKYKDVFSSCNRNFRIKKDAKPKLWCCECPKCAFVFLILAPFVDRDELIDTFGENLISKPELKTTYEELLGIRGHKPLECVGEIEECQQAATLAMEKFPKLKEFDT